MIDEATLRKAMIESRNPTLEQVKEKLRDLPIWADDFQMAKVFVILDTMKIDWDGALV